MKNSKKNNRAQLTKPLKIINKMVKNKNKKKQQRSQNNKKNISDN